MLMVILAIETGCKPLYSFYYGGFLIALFAEVKTAVIFVVSLVNCIFFNSTENLRKFIKFVTRL